MKRGRRVSLLPLVSLFASAMGLFSATKGSVRANLIDTKVRISEVYGKIPLYFIKNKGQVNRKALFYSRTKDYTLWITKEGILSVRTWQDKEGAKREVVTLKFTKPNKDLRVDLGKIEDYRVNYLIGNDRSKWITGIETSKEVVYRGIYEDIDLRIYGKGNVIEYDWIVRSGGDPADIRFEYSGGKSIKIDNEGNIVIETGFGKMVHKRPIVIRS